MGLATYGKTWTLANAANNAPRSPAVGNHPIMNANISPSSNPTFSQSEIIFSFLIKILILTLTLTLNLNFTHAGPHLSQSLTFTIGNGAQGTCTQQPGFLSYYEIKSMIASGGTEVYDDASKSAYAYSYLSSPFPFLLKHIFISCDPSLLFTLISL